MDQKITLGYWPMKGAGEPIRWLLHHIGQEFNEVNPTQETWPEQKAALEADGLAFPNLPYLVDGDWKMSESRAIPYYIAAKYERSDLFGNDWKEMARLKEFEGVYTDIKTDLMKVFFSPDYKTAIPEAVKEGSKVHSKLTYFSKFLGENEFFLGHVTYFDIGFAYFLTMVDDFTAGAGVENFTTQFANIVALKERVLQLPGIKEHLATPKGQVPFVPPTFLPWNKTA